MLEEYGTTVKIRGLTNRLSGDDYLKYNNNRYVNEIKYIQYNYFTPIIEINPINYKPIILLDFKENDIKLNTSKGIIYLDIAIQKPIFVLGYNKSLFHLLDIEFGKIDGKMFDTDDECIITKSSFEKDKWNDLKINDKIIFDNGDGFYKEFTIVGIIKENTAFENRRIHTTFKSAEYFDILQNNANIKGNTSYTDPENPQNIITFGYEAIVYLKSSDDFEKFRIEINKISNGNHYVDPVFENVNIIRRLIYGIKSWCLLFLLLFVFIFIGTTSITNAIFINNRKYEIAVLRSIGMKKRILILGYLIENIAFIFVIIIISIIISLPIFIIIANNIVDNHIIISIETREKIISIIKSIPIILSGTIALNGLSLVLVCINIIRFDPLKIFNKQY